MSVNKDYRTVQIPKDAHELLRAYCEETGYKMGKFLEQLIMQNCKPKKPVPGKVLLVDDKRG